jgi:hypothetical protein
MEEKEPYETNQKSDSPETDDEWTIHSLNIHGVLLQFKIAEIIATYNRRLSLLHTEYPVEISSEGKFSESRIDVLGVLFHRYNAANIYLIIECKKCNPEFVDWVFFPRIQKIITKTGFDEITILRNRFVYQEANKKFYAVNDFVKKRTSLFELAGDCRETRGNYDSVKNNIKTKTSNSAISEASYQVTLGTHGFAQEQIKPFLSKPLSELPETLSKQSFYFPIIVTTANLYKINFELSDINLSNGEIGFDKATLEEKDFIIYEYPISPYLQTGTIKSLVPYKIGSDLSMRRHVLIVNSKKFTSALDLLIAKDEHFFSNY